MRKKITSLFLAVLLLIPVNTTFANATTLSSSRAFATQQFSPSSGAFDAIIHRSKSGQHVVLRVKNPQLGQRVQLMRVERNNRLREVFSFTLQQSDLDSTGNYLNLRGGELVRTFPLSTGRTVFQVVVDGEEYLERKTLTRTSKPLVRLNSLSVQSPPKPITGTGEFRIEILDFQEGALLNSVCFFVDNTPLTSQLVTSLRIGNDLAQIDPQGCVTSQLGLDTNLPMFMNLNTKNLSDGAHSFSARAGFFESSGAARVSEASSNFATDNNSLNATAPNPTLSGNFVAGQYLTVIPGSWGPGVAFTYKWYSNGAEIQGATSDRYLLSFADVGKTLRAEVTGQKSEIDRAVRFIESTSAITDQITAPASQGGIPQGFTSFNVTEQGQVYDTVQRRFVTREVNNYNVNLNHPTVVICGESSSFFSTCSFRVSASWAGPLFESFELFSETVRLVRISDRTLLDTDFIFLSTSSSSSSDTLDFSFSISSLSTQNGLNQYQLEITDAGTGQVLRPLGASSIQIIRGPNSYGQELRFSSPDAALSAPTRSTVFRGGTSANPNWILWQYAYPTQVSVRQACAVIPFFVAPQSMVDGSLDDPTTKAAADATFTVYGSDGLIREKVSVNGSRGDWFSVAGGNKVDLKVCGLRTQRGIQETLRVQIDLRYDAFNQESTFSTSANIQLTGSLVFTRINCFRGEEGQVINAHQPTCPEGWTQTKAKVRDGRVEMKTVNCLAGRDLRVVRAPEPKCPEGYEPTRLAVRDGKLVPWTITCRKGFSKTTVRGVFPSCPAGYTRS